VIANADLRDGERLIGWSGRGGSLGVSVAAGNDKRAGCGGAWLPWQNSCQRREASATWLWVTLPLGHGPSQKARPPIRTRAFLLGSTTQTRGIAPMALRPMSIPSCRVQTAMAVCHSRFHDDSRRHYRPSVGIDRTTKQATSNQSGRQDLNLRPLDPQRHPRNHDFFRK
jgi:hypothetical protein